DVPARTDRESVRPKSVTYVSGINCYPCVRNGPAGVGGADGDRTRDLVNAVHLVSRAPTKLLVAVPRQVPWRSPATVGRARSTDKEEHVPRGGPEAGPRC